MATITTINENDSVAASRTVINENFDNLNQAIEGISVVETDPVFNASEAAKLAAGDKAKLDGIESGAQVNVPETDPVFGASEAAQFATGDKSKLDGIEAGAQVNVAETDPVFSASEAAQFAAGDKSKLDGIEAGAEVNNISDANATDLTDGGATTLHKHSYNNLDDKPTLGDAAAKNVGTAAGTVAAGDHNHTGVYAPVLGVDDNYMTDAEKTKLSGIADNANNYSLPTADAATLGGVKIGDRLSIDGSGVLSADVQSGGGDVVGPATSADNSIARFDGTNNKTIQGSSIVIQDNGQLEIPNDVSLYFGGGTGNGNSFKSGSDGSFLFDVGGGNNVAIKGGDNAGTNELRYTDSGWATQWAVDTDGNVDQKGDMNIATGKQYKINGNPHTHSYNDLDDKPTFSSSATIFSVHQVGHGLSVGNAIKSTGANTYGKAQADSAANAEVVGIVTAVADADNFTYTTHGVITAGVPAQTASTVMFLDPSTAGALTATEPTTVGQISKPVMIVLENGAKAEVNIMRGMEIQATDAFAKATGAEVDAGTDDAKYLTVKAINDSHNVPMVAPGTSGNVMQSNGTDWVSATPAPGGDMVVTALAGRGALEGGASYVWYIDGQQTVDFADGASPKWHTSIKIPAGATSISSVKVIYLRQHAGNVRLQVNFAVSPHTIGGTITSDSGIGTLAGGAADNSIGVWTLDTSWYNGLTIAAHSILGMVVYRLGGDGADTYASPLRVLGVEITFA